MIVDTAGHINYSNDKCPWWTVIVEKSTIVVQWTVIIVAATMSVHGGQLSLMDSYRCYTPPLIEVNVSDKASSCYDQANSDSFKIVC